ncbi:GalNAc-alpha-(1-_4)-GalNAc-alpha-(1-_3)-diNAcBac-PP-undecaprenol alpha-1,4-N-acetyl-D-galactosaminyltransferase [Gimesia alba]|uniref:GalNAc-alpha-(1->4)-GalNAc-alpha-(1->3)-diNAcBac-PP-undecaprenol alpha-1,4-N-acetyl-D-galactosaminyltransferase n=1 Tax=Gimesia alba TaxID=2527973 RepID=A0A517RG13_9PLAN|nr:glycosyltransferase [Gimesia alba]QDT42821.1 GalNAc-alpha-(1->4)-GalNAc-alpha-(1->3)-diNAcBac-PP-undecaprenol alpha-1,4-N-acetyl-D-galactosaminyltransferase [Gimesia alba]
MIKVSLLIPTLDQSGAEKQLALLATSLPRDEFEVQVIALTRGGPYESLLKEHDIPVTILNKRFKFDPLAYRALKKTLQKQQPDILHTWLFAANSYGRMAVKRLSASQKIPKVIVSERCVDSWKSNWQHNVDRRLLPQTSLLVGNSQGVVDFYREKGVPDSILRVVCNGIPIPDTSVCETTRNQLFQEHDLPENARLIAFVGRLARQKRIEDLLWALQLVRQMDENIILLLVGDGPERAKLEELTRQYTITPNVRFLGHRPDVNKLFPLFELFLLASDFEGQSNSIMEAMSYGIPVVASDIQPNRELVIHSETGFLTSVGDCTGFAQYAERILADPELAKQLGTAAQKRMQEEFSVDKMVKGYAALYHEVLK